jgi:signal transduction histidine kinase
MENTAMFRLPRTLRADAPPEGDALSVKAAPGRGPRWLDRSPRLAAMTIALGMSMVVSLADAIIDTLFFYHQPLLDVLIPVKEPIELYQRGTWLVAFAVFGLLMGHVLRSRQLAMKALAESEERRRNLVAEQMKSDFTDTISHELKTPLTVMIGHATLAERLMDAGDPGRARDSLHAIGERGAFMAELVDDLLRMMKINAGQHGLQRRETDLGELVRDCAARAHMTPAHRMELDIQGPLPRMRCDPDRLAGAVSSLIDNAVKFSPAGGPIRVRAARFNGSVQLKVADSGIGIAPEHLELIFGRFTQCDMTATRRFGGLGMGLFIAKTIVEEHGGDVTVESRLGGGTTFTVDLPLEAAKGADEPAEALLPASSLAAGL